MALASDHDMIVHDDAERFSSLRDLPRKLDILSAGRRISAGVIVDEDQ